MPGARAECSHILLVESNPGSLNELARRLRLTGAEPVSCPDFADAQRLLASRDPEIGVAMIDTALAHRGLRKQVAALRKQGPVDFVCVATGPEPSNGDRKLLRNAGLRLALFDPYDDGTLRFQLNRALNGDRDHHKRAAERVPTYLHATVTTGHRVKDAVAYTLSTSGAFLGTARASMSGADIDLSIRLPGRSVETPAQVVFANVPGNLQRPNLPLGMGVRFTGTPSETSKELKAFVRERLAELEV